MMPWDEATTADYMCGTFGWLAIISAVATVVFSCHPVALASLLVCGTVSILSFIYAEHKRS